MKKLTLLLLLWVSAMTAQVSNGNETYSDYGFRSDPAQLQIPSVSDWISTIGTDGTFGKILPVNITIPYTPINYSATSQTLGAQIAGIDTRLGQISGTTAGNTQRVYFTADNTTVTAGTFFTSSLSGKGSTPSGSPSALVLGDNTKGYFNKDVISASFATNTIAYGGTYSGNLTVSASPTPNATQQRFTIELYKTNNGGTPIASGISGAPVGDLGVTVIAILDSGIINLTAGAITNINVTGILTQNLNINSGERLRYHFSAAKEGTGGGSVTFGVYYGSAYNSYYDVPVAVNTDGVLNKSSVTGITSTDALNALNTALNLKSNDTDVIHKTTDETKIGTLTVNKTQTSGGVALVGQSTTKANGEQFYGQSGESVLGVSAPVIESQSGGIGTDFTPSNTVVALKFSTTASASFIQGIRLRMKKTGALTDLSAVVVRMYTDNLGVPGTAFGGGGTIFANNISSTYTDVDAIIQNVTIPISTSTPYWVVITRTESGGSFVFDSSIGTGTTYQGATTETANVDTGRQIFNTIYARSAYGGHFVAEHSHGAWGTSITGAGIRGDSKSHFGGFFKSRDDWGSQSESTNSGGSIGISVNGVGSAARTSSTNVNTPAFRAEHTSGITGLGSIVSGRSYLLGRTVIGAGVDYNATLEVVGGISRFSGKVLLNATGVDVSTQDKGFTLDVNGSILKRAFGVTTPYTSVGNGELSIGGRAGGTVPAITTRTNSTTLTGMLITAIQNANTTRTGDADIILKTGFENGSDAIQTLTTAGAALQVLNNTTPLLNVYRNGNVSIGSPPDAGYKLDVDGTAIIRSILTLSATPTTSVGTYEIVTRNSATGVVEKITSSTLPNLGVKTYTALINQTGTSAPTVTVLGSNTVGTIVWTRSTSGFYFGTLSGAFPAGKTFFTITPSSSSASYAMFRNTDNQIVIRTQDNSTVPFTDSDDKLFSNSIRIEVYP